MLQALFHAWERQLSDVTKNRVVRPFDWGLDWLPAFALPAFALGASARRAESAGHAESADIVRSWVASVMADTDAFFTPAPTTQYVLSAGPWGAGDGASSDRLLTFPSALETPHARNNTVYCRLIEPKKTKARPRAAVLVMPQWNSDPGGHVGLCRLLAMNGMTALRLSLPYHDQRMPPELQRADYIVSSNVVRTVQACRQAVLDARRAIAWLAQEGYDRIGILGTSLGSCLAMLTTAHEPLIKAAALNHISPYFADVVWEGLSTMHVRETLEGNVTLDELRRMWLPISPLPILERVRGRDILLVYAKYDLTFPVGLSRMLVERFSGAGIEHDLLVLPCGHYSTGVSPFKWMDGIALCRFLNRALR
jgi:hypothetical protein